MSTITNSRNLFVWVVVTGALLVGGDVGAQVVSADLMPTGRVVYPGLSNQGFKLVPPTFNIGSLGFDPDSPDGRPARYRFLFKPAINSEGGSIRTPFEYSLHYEEVLSLDDPEWSDWQDVPVVQDDIRVQFVDLPSGEYFFFSVQFMDQDGAVSDPWGYQIGTAHVKILDHNYPLTVTLMETFLGTTPSSEFTSEIAGGQPLNFSWTAGASGYNGEIVSYRHGWDLVSSDDPNDPGWAVPPGVSEQNLYASERVFQEGNHSFTLRVEDGFQNVRLMVWNLRVVPFVSRDFQHEIMVLDQVVDHLVQNWPDQSGAPRNDESYRNPWWHFLADGSGGVANINWERDWFDHSDQINYSDVVKYKVVLCYAQFNDGAEAHQMFRQFRAVNDVDRFVWLTPYQQRGGNLFLVGGGSMESFIEGKPNYMVPTIFDTTEETLVVDGQSYEVGFGTKELPNGISVQRGPLMYPYATAGISALDWTSPNTKTIYNRPHVARFDRTADCVGLKGVVLDEAFKNWHLIGPGVVADTIFTEPEIDWHDVVDAAADTMRLFHLTFPFRNDEFVDANISSRTTPIIPQDCPYAPVSPGGMCIEPMFRGISRFDYIRQYRWERGETDWPSSRYDDFTLEDGCGPLALTSYEGLPNRSVRTNGQTYGYLSYKVVEDKPVHKADVYWGFDPYRFDHNESRKAIRWVLQYFGLTINQ